MNWLIRHAMCAMMPGGGELPGLTASEATAYARRVRAESDWLYSLGLCLGAVVFAITPLITLGIPLPAFLLPSGLLDRHAQRVVEHRSYLIRQAVFLVRLNAGMCWGALADKRASLSQPGYPGDPGTFRTD